MIRITVAVLYRSRLCLQVTLLLALTGCAGTGMFGSQEYRPIVVDDAQAVPEYVQNLPKSRSGNMAQYTVFGKRYRVMDSAANFTEQGVASWYGKKFHGRKTSSGEVYDMYALTAAHKHLPLPTFVRVTNLDNNQSVVVKVNDRGPFVGDRVIDMSYTAAQLLGMVENGTARVRVDALSTHLVDENPNSSNVTVADAFSRDEALGNQEPQNGGPLAPDVLEAQLAAVPLQMPLQPENVLDSGPLNAAPELATAPNEATVMTMVPALETATVQEREFANAQATTAIQVDGSEDGFVEAPELGAAVLAETAMPALDEPAEVGKLISEQTPLSVTSTKPNRSNVYIQLGAFSQSANAHALVNDVDEQTGLPAYVEKDAERGLFRVKMGPFQHGNVLENTLEALASVGIDSYTKLAAKY